MPAPSAAHGGAAGGDLQEEPAQSQRGSPGDEAAHRHGGAGVWQHPAQQAIEPVHAARPTQGGGAVAAVLPGAQHREAGRVRPEDIVGGIRVLFGVRMSAEA